MVYGFVIKKGSSYDQFTKTGWWDSYSFLPRWGEKEGNQVWFNGIVSSFKLRRGKWSCVLMMIGVDNGKYLDLIAWISFRILYLYWRLGIWKNRTQFYTYRGTRFQVFTTYMTVQNTKWKSSLNNNIFHLPYLYENMV